ncbi:MULTISPECIES: uracil-xanthine permease family protein [unclassified Thioalkalivibrio]|uniref:uracil-xanthine permease family protein n=1 Tax=unclassified Thioalkalivibrio TaxID=2621013 RepID=UPI00038227CD|nr:MULTISPECIES: solute carrier family 23 protein [unclassified Thioalkalivibrio]
MTEPSQSKILYEVDDHPPVGKCALSALQSLILVAPTIILAPLILARTIGLDLAATQWTVFAALIGSALATLVQVRRVGPVGSGYLIFMGTSTAYLAVGIEAAMVGGMALVATLAILSAPAQLLFARYLGLFRRIITPTVSGVVIMLLVLTVIPSTADMMHGEGEYEGTWRALVVALFTLGFTILLAIFGGRMLRLWAPIIGLGVGVAVAVAFNITDFSRVADAAWLGLPPLEWPGFTFEFSTAWFTLLLTFIIVTLVGSVESVGDTMVAQRNSHRTPRKVDYDRVRGGLYADGVGNMIAGGLGTLPNTTYGIGVSSIELTGMAARRVGYYFAGFLALVALIPKLNMVMISLPGPVFGAFLLILLALLFVAGIRLCAQDGLSYQSGLIIGVAFSTGFLFQNQLFFHHLIPDALGPFMNNSVTTGGTVAVAISLIFNLRPRPRRRSTFAPEAESLPQIQAMAREFGESLSLPEKQSVKLQVALEEVFMHLSEQAASEPGRSRPVDVRLEREGEHLAVEMIDRSAAAEVDEASLRKARQWGHNDEQSLRELGLYLLNSLAQDVRHLRMAGVNYISFSIPLRPM